MRTNPKSEILNRLDTSGGFIPVNDITVTTITERLQQRHLWKKAFLATTGYSMATQERTPTRIFNPKTLL